jgi:hypothetical protein
MSFLGDTILIPEVYDLPKNFAYFKVIKTTDKDAFVSDDIQSGTRIYITRKENFSPVLATVVFSNVYDNLLLFLVKDDIKPYTYSINTNDYFIMEVDQVDGDLLNPKLTNIGDAEESELIQELRRDPSLAERIPRILWERPGFQKKILSANLPIESDLIPENVKTMARMNRLHFLGKSGIFDHDDLTDLPLTEINDYLGIKSEPHTIDAARVEKSVRPPPPPRPIPPPPMPTTKCKGSRCSISGGTRKRKKKRKVCKYF